MKPFNMSAVGILAYFIFLRLTNKNIRTLTQMYYKWTAQLNHRHWCKKWKNELAMNSRGQGCAFRMYYDKLLKCRLKHLTPGYLNFDVCFCPFQNSLSSSLLMLTHFFRFWTNPALGLSSSNIMQTVCSFFQSISFIHLHPKKFLKTDDLKISFFSMKT